MAHQLLVMLYCVCMCMCWPDLTWPDLHASLPVRYATLNFLRVKYELCNTVQFYLYYRTVPYNSIQYNHVVHAAFIGYIQYCTARVKK